MPNDLLAEMNIFTPTHLLSVLGYLHTPPEDSQYPSGKFTRATIISPAIDYLLFTTLLFFPFSFTVL
ncbi:hypothetical protein L873DRAFT_1798346, partial [Choiromyces venosus 120613-1]